MKSKRSSKLERKKGMPSNEIREDSMGTLGKESSSYSTVKKWAAEFKRGRER